MRLLFDQHATIRRLSVKPVGDDVSVDQQLKLYSSRPIVDLTAGLCANGVAVGCWLLCHEQPRQHATPILLTTTGGGGGGQGGTGS